MSFSQSVRALGVCCCLAAVFSSAVFGQSNVPVGNEYCISGQLAGDQTHPQVSIGSNGGYLLWEDNATDGSGLGISALRVDGTLSGALAPFRVNQIGSGDQEHGEVSLLNNGGAVFIWQSGKPGSQKIFARYRSMTNTWLTGDVTVSGNTNVNQITPAITTLNNGNVVATWASYNQRGPGTLNDVYGRILTASGQKVGAEFPINQFSQFNQRSADVAALAGGGFVVVWISEQQRSPVGASTNAFSGTNDVTIFPQVPQWTSPSVDVYARIFDANGTPQGDEFLVNTSSKVCASPSIVASADGGFVVAWMEKDVTIRNNGWDVCSRSFTLAGAGGPQRFVNTQLYGDQLTPKISVANGKFLVVWTSLGQDGNREGVYGQFLNSDGSLSGSEFQVNTTTLGAQMHPTVSSDGSRFLVAWSGFVSLMRGFDVFAQRIGDPAQDLAAPAAPTVTTVSSNALRASWAPVGGLNVSNYEVYADESATATAIVTNTSWTMFDLSLNSTHSFRVAYVLTDGRRSPLSAPGSGTTGDVSDAGSQNPDVTDPGTNSGSNSNLLQKLPFPNGSGSTNGAKLSFAAVQGSYSGLFYNSENVSSDSAGYVLITATAKGGFSAKLQLGAQSYSFSGTFNGSGHWGPILIGGKKGALPLRVELNLDLFGNNQISGTISNPGKWSATLLALRAGYNKAHLTPLAGNYTFVIPGTANAGSPAGNSIGNLTVDALGNVQWSGALADGTSIGQRTILSQNNVWPLYASLYGGKGVVLGWVGFGNVSNYDAYGPVIWIKPVDGAGVYPNGFTNQTFLVSAIYTPVIVAKASVAAGKMFGNSRLVFSEGSLESSIEQPITWDGSKVVVQGGGALTFTLSPVTGLFRGNFVEPGSGQNLTFQGVLFENTGLGYFLSGNQSGKLYLGPNP